MEPELIAAIGSGGLALLLLVLLWVSRRGRRRARSRSTALERDLTTSHETAATARAGEREAVWALQETNRLLGLARLERADAWERIAELEARVDDLRDRLVAADDDLALARREVEEAEREMAHRESDRPTSNEDPALVELRRELRTTEEALERERANVVRLERAVASEDGGSRESDSGYRERLVASEARRRDLEDRIASLMAVRTAEQRSTGERIAGLERLHTEIGDRERRIDELETDLKQASESRDEALEEAARLQVEIVRLKGELARANSRISVLEEHSAALAEARSRIAELEANVSSVSSDELGRLRKSLEAERTRAERLARRATETPTDTSYAMWDRVVRERVETAVDRETRRLAERVEHLRAVVEEKEERLRALTGSASGTAEDLDLPPITAIKGIGQRIAGILVARGVATVADIAELTDEQLDALGSEMPVYPERVWDDDWRGQARALLDAARSPRPEQPTPSGPPPLTAIKGIGPKIASILAEHGVRTMADVAALTEPDIARLGEAMPVYPGRIIDDDWVGQARSFL